MDRFEMIDQLYAIGHNRHYLEQLTFEELKALYEEDFGLDYIPED